MSRLSGSPRLGPGANPGRAKPLVADKSAEGIAIFDPVDGRLLRTRRVGSDPEQFALDPAEQFLVVANEDCQRSERASSCPPSTQPPKRAAGRSQP